MEVSSGLMLCMRMAGKLLSDDEANGCCSVYYQARHEGDLMLSCVPFESIALGRERRD